MYSRNALFIVLVACTTFLFFTTWKYPAVTTSSVTTVTAYFTSSSTCPSAFEPLKDDLGPIQRAECRDLSTNTTLHFSLQVCYSTSIANYGYFLLTSRSPDCASFGADQLSSDASVNQRYMSVGPDVFHFVVNGEHRWAAELEVEYIGSCLYKFPFRLASAVPSSVSAWWLFRTKQAALETEFPLIQRELGQPLLDPPTQMITPPAQTAKGCTPVQAVPSQQQWLSAAEAEYLSALPDCSRRDAVHGRYLRAHWSEPRTFQGFAFQPDGCRWSNPVTIGATANVTRAGFQQRNVLFLGDSHVRYAFDVMSYVYKGDWGLYWRVPTMKALKKTEHLGPVNITFIWDSVLREFDFKLTCDSLAGYDTIVLGSGQHQLILTTEKDHDKQWSAVDFGKHMENIASRLAPSACGQQRMPQVIWIGNPARPVRTKLPPPAHPLMGTWKDARTNIRLRLMDEYAWRAFSPLPGAARVDMYDLTSPFAEDFMDQLHMVMTDAQTALVQDLHQKLALTSPAQTRT